MLGRSMALEYDGGTVSSLEDYDAAIANGAIAGIGGLAENFWDWTVDTANNFGAAARTIAQALASLVGAGGDGTLPGGPGGVWLPNGTPFIGGQCSTRYFIRLQRQAVANFADCARDSEQLAGPFETQSGLVWGPVISITPIANAPQACPQNNYVNALNILCYGEGGAPTASPVLVEFEFVSQPSSKNVQILGVERNDGQPDTCGDPPAKPPGYPEPTVDDRTVNVNIDVDIGNDNRVSVTVPVVIGPIIVDLDGRIAISAKINNEVSISIPFNFAPTFNIGPGGESGPVESDDGENLPDEPPGRTLCGLLVTTTEISPSARQIELANNDVYYTPRLGSVSFRVDTPAGIFPTAEIEVNKVEQFVPVPLNCFGASGWDSHPYLGTKWEVTPIYSYHGGGFNTSGAVVV